MNTQIAQPTEGRAVRALRQCLNDGKIVSLDGLVRELGFNRTFIERELHGMIEKSEIDVLTSCCLVTRSDGTLAPEEVEFYRARQVVDLDWLLERKAPAAAASQGRSTPPSPERQTQKSVERRESGAPGPLPARRNLAG